MNETINEVPGATAATVMAIMWVALIAAAPFLALV